ncbi:serine hydrolase domain-containing protein [Emcibacter sp. SYSU 3D8]|uniref:serine hydrolase domain-containing protein n=1 Tax=Emcibacter sp. SYSU 3D8 TaxID=3133969 RepID=UPI0031FEDF14
MGKTKHLGLSAERLDRITETLERKYVAPGEIPGSLIQVWRRGELAYTGITGSMDLERGKPLREDTIFRIYSMSKPITAVALMILVEQGLIGLDDDVATHIPSWKNLAVFAGGVPGAFITTPVKRPMKVIDLLTHTAGLTYGFLARTNVDAAYRKRKVADMPNARGLEGFIEDLAELPLECSPGDAWNYSVSIDVLGYLVQKISGETFGDFLRSRLFEPLGMRDTAFHVPAEKIERFATCYVARPEGGIKLQDDAQASTYAAPAIFESGGGGLVSTAGDYMRFCRMLLNGGELDGARILSPKTVALFSLNHLPGGKDMTELGLAPALFNEAGYAGVGFSLACGVTIDVARTRLPGTVGEFFWGGAASTAFWIDPKEDLAVVFMTQVLQSPHHISLRRDLRTLVYSALTESDA